MLKKKINNNKKRKTENAQAKQSCQIFLYNITVLMMKNYQNKINKTHKIISVLDLF